MSDPKDAEANLEKLKTAVRRYSNAFFESEVKSAGMALDALMMELDAPENRCPVIFCNDKDGRCQLEVGHKGSMHQSGHVMWSESKRKNK